MDEKQPNVIFDNVTVGEVKSDAFEVKGDIKLSMKDSSFDKVGGKFLVSDNQKAASNSSNQHWYKKPIGIISIAVISGVLVSITVWVINHYLGLGLG